MPELFGASYGRGELTRRIGRLEQVAGVRLVTLGDGQGRGVRVLEFRTGTGFAFDVLVDRSFDIGRCAGRQDARERGELQWLEPSEERRYELEIGALPGAAAIREFEARVSRLAAPASVARRIPETERQ